MWLFFVLGGLRFASTSLWTPLPPPLFAVPLHSPQPPYLQSLCSPPAIFAVPLQSHPPPYLQSLYGPPLICRTGGCCVVSVSVGGRDFRGHRGRGICVPPSSKPSTPPRPAPPKGRAVPPPPLHARIVCQSRRVFRWELVSLGLIRGRHLGFLGVTGEAGGGGGWAWLLCHLSPPPPPPPGVRRRGPVAEEREEMG